MVSRYQPPRSVSFRYAVHRRRPHRLSFGTVAGLALLVLWLYTRRYGYFSTYLPCQDLPGASDTVVIMKTGVTELEDRLPIHLDTTLRCFPNYVIFSDHEELYQGRYPVRDVLSNISPGVRGRNEDFELYRKVKAVGRAGLDPVDLTGRRTTSKSSKDQKVQIAGWVLDKWKFLPMINETYHLYPNKKWYIFMETDTYLFWTTILKYISNMDHTKPYCLGHRSTIRSEWPFAHGGSGYIFSNPAMRLLRDYIEKNREDLDDFVASHWAGDIVLGSVLRDVGIPITPIWPMLKPHHFGVLDFGLTYEDKRFWCYPAGSFHHMTPDTIEDLWKFEQDWITQENEEEDPNTFISHADIFNNYLLPGMRFPRDGWNNQCDETAEGAETAEDCKAICMGDDSCLQYSFDGRTCNTSDIVKMGEASSDEEVYSDWVFDRIELWRDRLPPCHGEGFIYPALDSEL